MNSSTEQYTPSYVSLSGDSMNKGGKGKEIILNSKDTDKGNIILSEHSIDSL